LILFYVVEIVTQNTLFLISEYLTFKIVLFYIVIKIISGI